MNCPLCRDNEHLRHCPLCGGEPVPEDICGAFRVGGLGAAAHMSEAVVERVCAGYNAARIPEVDKHIAWALQRRVEGFLTTRWHVDEEHVDYRGQATHYIYNPITDTMHRSTNVRQLIAISSTGVSMWQPAYTTVDWDLP